MKKYGSIIIVLIFIIAVATIAFWSGSKNKDNMENQANDTSNVTTTESGLKVEVVEEGAGDAIQNGQTAVVNYTGTFEDGRKFDSSLDRGVPFEFMLGAGQVIKGWDDGVLGMKVGEKIKLTVPPELGYGMEDYGPIPGGSTLYFDVELMGIK